MDTLNDINWQSESAILMSSHLRIARQYHKLVRQKETNLGTFYHYEAINPQGRGIIYAKNVYHLRNDGTMICKSKMWRETRKGKLMDTIDTTWYACPNFLQIVNMHNVFHRNPNWNMN